MAFPTARPAGNGIDRTAMAYPSRLAGSTGRHWLTRAAEMADLASGNWPLSPDPAPTGWSCLPRIATRTPGVDAGSVRVARDFTIATLQRWGVRERSEDIAVVVSELLTNALQHARPGSGDARPRWPIRLGLLQPGPCVLCAVADPSEVAPVADYRAITSELPVRPVRPVRPDVGGQMSDSRGRTAG